MGGCLIIVLPRFRAGTGPSPRLLFNRPLNFDCRAKFELSTRCSNQSAAYAQHAQRKYSMKLISRSFAVLAAFLAAMWISASPGRATSSAPAATFGILPGTSSPLGISATQPDPNAGIYVYTYTVSSGDALSDMIPLSVCLDALSNPESIPWSDQVEVSNV